MFISTQRFVCRTAVCPTTRDRYLEPFPSHKVVVGSCHVSMSEGATKRRLRDIEVCPYAWLIPSTDQRLGR